MKTIDARNVQQAFPVAMDMLKGFGVLRDSRAGKVLEIPTPVGTTYHRPWERVIFYQERDANPFFHLMESLWMLAGRRDVKWLAQFNARMAEYSDDGEVFNAAYGYRLRSHFGVDQLAGAAKALRANPDDRRVVCQIWDYKTDFLTVSKDIPCNDLIMFKVRNGSLHMTVANRSNDAIWGCYGANAVHFSFIQEYVASMAGLELGPYTQVSDSLHVYADLPQWGECQKLADLLHNYVPRAMVEAHDPYTMSQVTTRRLVDDPERFDMELEAFMSGMWSESCQWHNKFFPEIAIPMASAWVIRKSGDTETALTLLASMPHKNDWKRACIEWVHRRMK